MPLPYKKTSRQGNNVVLREEKLTPSGVPVYVVKAHAKVQRADTRPETWRRALSKLTNGGKDMQLVLLDLMNGNAYTPRVFDRDGKELPNVRCEPIIPSAEVRRAAAMNLHEMLHGKAVAETEVISSEREAEKVKQLESMSDAQLEAFIEGEYLEFNEGEEPAPGEEDAGLASP